MSFGRTTTTECRDAALSQLARLRQGIYALLAVAFQAPGSEWLGRAQEMALGLGAGAGILRGLAFVPSWEAFRLRLLATSEAELQKPDDSALRETQYVYPDATIQCDVVADLEASYHQAALRHTGPTPPDHLGAELSFLSVLCAQEAEGWEAGRRDRVMALLRRQAAFLDDHLCRWLPLVAARLSEDRPPDLHSLAAMAAWGLANHDRDMASLILAELAEDEHVR
ncbi:MAG: hypothetical protein Kow0010_21300 [Dehalococcoidia bacterium]